jgi:sugar lactone lactonase YvrE
MDTLQKKSSIFVDGLDHPECVAVHPDGSVWAGGEGGQIYRISKDGNKVDEIVNTGGFILGIAFSPGGEWLAICDLNNHCLWKLDIKSKKLVKFSDGAEYHKFNIPNYPVFDNSGNLYVTESGAFREVTGKVLKYKPDGSGMIWHDGPFNFANGLALDSDQSSLYVVSSWFPGVEKIKINSDGSAGNRSVYCTLPETVPDGIAFDDEGSLLVSCYAPNRIFKVDKDETVSVLYDDWEAHTLSNPTNIAFGGKNFDQLFVSNLGRWHILKIDYGKKGMPPASHQGVNNVI